MLTDRQFWRIKQMHEQGKKQQNIADKLEVDRKTVAKSIKSEVPPSLQKKDRHHRTRKNSFSDVWDFVIGLLMVNPGLEVKTIFKELQRLHQGKFQDGQKRTLERQVRSWRLEHGPEKEIYFEQIHHPGDLCSSDYTRMGKLNITIQRKPFDHLLYHFVLTYSNWETVTICHSESFESLSEGFQNAVWKLGGVPSRHRTDNLGAAVINFGGNKGEMTKRYNDLLDHYNINRDKIQPGKPNENGDVESSNGHLKKALDQQLMLRGSRDFASLQEYKDFLQKLLDQLNSGRSVKYMEEIKHLRKLPAKRSDACTPFSPTVSKYSTITLNKNVYSVPSKWKGTELKVKQFCSTIEMWFGNKLLDIIPRTIGEKDTIDYRHVIGWLVKKPGAFENYKYKAYMFPTSYFREAYDNLLAHDPSKASREYLKILYLAATYIEKKVNLVLKDLLDSNLNITFDDVEERITAPIQTDFLNVRVNAVDLNDYDELYSIRFENEE
jgi:hypothetical protein